MYEKQFMFLSGITPEEHTHLQTATTGLNEQQMRLFLTIYLSKRKNPNDMLLFGIIGFFFLPGLLRFVVRQTGLGILYLFTFGLCFIGSIVDLVNYKEITFEYNQKIVFETMQFVRMENRL